jgi:acyl dehydratase
MLSENHSVRESKMFNDVKAGHIARLPQTLRRSDIILFVAFSSGLNSAHVDGKSAKRDMWINHLCLGLRLCDVERKARQEHFGVSDVNANHQSPA